MESPASLYAIGLGSNRRHGRHGAPAAVITAAQQALAALGGIVARAPTITTAPLGPGSRRFANAVLLVESPRSPSEMLAALKAIERRFGRRRGRRWGDRVIDLDILLWSGGPHTSRGLSIPHPGLPHRRFVLDPLSMIAPDWRLPGSPLRIRHLAARLTRRAPIHKARDRSGP